jgi:hypothetical protein
MDEQESTSTLYEEAWYWCDGDTARDHLTVSQLRWDDNGELITHHESTP